MNEKYRTRRKEGSEKKTKEINLGRDKEREDRKGLNSEGEKEMKA